MSFSFPLLLSFKALNSHTFLWALTSNNNIWFLKMVTFLLTVTSKNKSQKIKGEMSLLSIKINKQKPQLKQSQKVRERVLMPFNGSRAQQEEQKLPLLSWQEFSQWETAATQPMNSYRLFFQKREKLPHLPYFLYKEFLSSLLLGACTWLTMVADFELQFVLGPK